MWGWNMHYSQKIEILALHSSISSIYACFMERLNGMKQHGEHKQKFQIILMGDKGKEER